jgi:hypothetical protein
MISLSRAARAGAFVFASCLALPLLAASSAQAQTDDELIPATKNFVSSERFVVEFRGGPYKPDLGNDNSFKTFFATDSGPLLDIELDYIALRVPDILYVTAGGNIGLSSYTGHALGPSGTRVSEETNMTILPMTALGSLRIDALPRKLSIPFIFSGKIGWEWAHWSTGTGKRDDASGWSMGLYYAGELALDLDTFEKAAARSMDEEWGINHSFVMFEVFHFEPTSKSLPIGATAWLIGLGFNF